MGHVWCESEFLLLGEPIWIYSEFSASKLVSILNSLSRILREEHILANHGDLWAQTFQLWISEVWLHTCEMIAKIFPNTIVKIIFWRHNVLKNISESCFLLCVFKSCTLISFHLQLILVLGVWLSWFLLSLEEVQILCAVVKWL